MYQIDSNKLKEEDIIATYDGFEVFEAEKKNQYD